MRLLLLSVMLGSLGCTEGPAAAPRPAAAATKVNKITILAVAEVRGTPEPCGCASDPLGNVGRVLTLLAEARKGGGALLVDAGGLRYGEERLSDEKKPQARLKAEFLETAWAEGDVIVGLGNEDLQLERPPAGRRIAVNVTGMDLAPPALREVGGVKVGVFGVLDAQAVVPKGMLVSDPVAAAKLAVADLRGRGAQVIVVLAHQKRAEAKRLARQVPGLTLVVVGDEVNDGGQAEQVGETILVQPANEAQRVARVELLLGEGGRVGTTLFAGEAGRKAQLERATGRLVTLEAEIARLEKATDADPSYVTARKQERKQLTDEKQRLEAERPTPPPPPYATAQLVAMNRAVEREPKVVTALQALDARVGEANRVAGEKRPVPPVGPGEARYVGGESCGDCHQHEDSTTLWKKTVHARAWETLVKVNKQWSYDCIKCHVTGYGERGGSAMAHVDNLTDVQCEVCHGPGSLHAAKPKLVKMPVHAPDKTLCEGCHTKEHSDTFQFEAYLRDVLGPSHGAQRRAALGDGPTARELRAAAVARAKTH